MRIHTRAALLATTGALLCLPSQAAASADGVIVEFRSNATVAQIASLTQRVGAGQVTDKIRGTNAVVSKHQRARTARRCARALRARHLCGEEQDSAHAGDAERLAVQRPLRPQQHGPDRRHERRRHRRARGLGRRRARRLPRHRRGQGRHRRHRNSDGASGPERQGRQLRAVAGHPADLRRHDSGRLVRRRQRPRHPRRGHDLGEREQRHRRDGRLVQLAAHDLQGAGRRSGHRKHRRRRQLHHGGRTTRARRSSR